MAELNPESELNPEQTLHSFYETGISTWEQAFPPVCLKSHWDPSRLTSQYVLPPTKPLINPLSLDPRPNARICTQYYNSSAGDAPIPNGSYDTPVINPSDVPAPLKGKMGLGDMLDTSVLPTPPGGHASVGEPYYLYAENVDRESNLLRLGENLSRCKQRKYHPVNSIVENATNEIPAPATNSKTTFNNVGDVTATTVKSQAGCREQDDNAAWNRSSRYFFNPTKYDRYFPDESIGPLACLTGGAPAPAPAHAPAPASEPEPIPTSASTAFSFLS